MSLDWYQDLVNFHNGARDSFDKKPHIPEPRLVEMRKTLIKEEIQETFDGMDSNDLVEVADGIVDSIVVLLGTAVTYGIDVRPIWDEVHRTNMAKVDCPIRRDDGKILKPKNWVPPNVVGLLKEQMAK